MVNEQAAITAEYLKSRIRSVAFSSYVPSPTMPPVIACAITVVNGFIITGLAACPTTLGYDQGLIKRYAYENAYRQLRQLESFMLREKLWRANGEKVDEQPSAGKDHENRPAF